MSRLRSPRPGTPLRRREDVASVPGTYPAAGDGHAPGLTLAGGATEADPGPGPGPAAPAGATELIEGVRVVPLKRIPDERGTIMHMLRADDPHFLGFGEIYFTSVYRGVVKGWHRHREMTLNYACVHGRIKLVLFDDRSDSPSRGSIMELYPGPDQHVLVQIPPLVWNGMKGMSDPAAVVANCCTHAHDPAANRTDRLAPEDATIPYDWAIRCS